MGYVSVDDMRDVYGVTETAVDDTLLEVLIEQASRLIDTWTGWWFEPREMTLRLDGSGNPCMVTGIPICRVDEVRVLDGDFGPASSVVEASVYRVYNRHLSGMTRPDDRQYARIELARFGDPRPVLSSLGYWPEGRQNVEVDGAFGYTDRDPEGDVDEGVTPKAIAYATALVIIRILRAGTPASDVEAWNESAAAAGGIQSLRTRDQSMTFFGGLRSGQGGVASFPSGDPEVDRILLPYVRPPDVATV